MVEAAEKIVTLVDNDVMRISAALNPSDRITLCFTGIGHAYGGIDVQREEFRKSADFASSIYIIDKERSWGNNLDFGLIRQVVESFGPANVVNAIGNSMGGFLAILATKFIKIDNCVAFVPQYSVHKDIIPNENRWDKWVDKIKEWKYVDLGNSFNDRTRYYIIAGVGKYEDQHLEKFPDRPNINKIYFRNRRYLHNTAQALKEENVLYDVILDCFSGHSASEVVATRFQNVNYGAFVGGA